MTLLVTAGGYVINDMQDIYTDEINKPDKKVIGHQLSLKTARQLYLLLNFLALACAIFIFYKTQSFNILALCGVCILILWMYSKYFKSTILMGNVVVSLLIGLVPFIFVIIESNAFGELYDEVPSVYLSVYSVILSFTIFAFFANLIREIIKDSEDLEGDQRAGILTLATALGLKKADLVSQVLTVVLFITTLIWLFFKEIYTSGIELTVFILIVILPITYLFWKINRAERHKSKYIILSRQIKFIMIFGLVYLLVHLNMNYA
ncbi:prenyltransferase [Portibacter lacus]|uniref:Prenyltransferase n=2 Tax=Portibacter lacus TaxID=1099794 RepID=A0AA37SJA1_9BACT|nr:prenyltransferase [Portibacter lacus]